MLEKLKAFADSARGVFMLIVGPFVFLAGFLWYYISKSHRLEDEIKATEGQKKLNELQGEQKQIDSHANDAVSAFESFLEHGTGPGDVQKPGSTSNPGSTSSDSNS